MSGLNASLGYFVVVVITAFLIRILIKKWPRFSFMLEFASSFMLVGCLLEVQTIVEVGEWAGGLGPDVTVTMLFVVLLSHGIICGAASGNPSVSLQRYLQKDASALPTLLALVAQFLGSHLAILVAFYYWSLELTDMHMIKNLMASECSTSLKVSLLQGFFTEFFCASVLHLILLSLWRRSALIRIPLIAVLLTFLSHSARNYTSGFVNPCLAYGLTFHCPGFSYLQYSLVYWLSSVTGMILALFLFMGHIPKLFSKNLLYSQKKGFRAPKADKSEKKKK
ncbi:aquaporin 12 [Periophthalmus magnuspinnatus]|uniref:Aquaporin n=1 Tax=Periophthalmus magnuspinnatus TaxID=409849 RepID=A0A3B4A609_9GOBI|nr:aquaporin 12 [Periophthalmus magnuspinnatus]